MVTKMLAKARTYEEKNRPEIVGQLPAFHLTGGVGWINDPNGFAPYKGEYHLFFQYYPYDVQWGPMHWGHAKTKDFIRWEMLPAALAPDEWYDKDGCFSGGAAELPDGRHLLIYTGVCREEQPDGHIEDRQTQCIAFGDGVNYEKFAQNPVITAADLPKGGSPIDFRDPKIWWNGDNLIAAIANRGEDNSGSVLLYESRDGIHWKYCNTIAYCGNRYGKMWECPDLFSLDGKDVLIHGAQEMLPERLEYHGGNGEVCHVGHFDKTQCCFVDENIHALEYGLDFYAAQTLQASDGRRIMVGWMQSWESSSHRIGGMRFKGMMTIPRELLVKDNRVCQNPVRELENYHGIPVVHKNVSVKEETTLPGISGRILDMTIQVKPQDECYECFTLKIAKGESFFTTITLFPRKDIIRIDRTYSGYPHDVVHIRDIPVSFSEGNIRLRLIMDKYSFELFVNDGEQAASNVFYTPQSARGITFESDKIAHVDVTMYPLNFD